MDIIDLLIENLGMVLAMANVTMNQWMVMPLNATSPLDPNITLTSEGFMIVDELANAAIGLSNVLAEAMEILF